MELIFLPFSCSAKTVYLTRYVRTKLYVMITLKATFNVYPNQMERYVRAVHHVYSIVTFGQLNTFFSLSVIVDYTINVFLDH